jgi:hypothetical protein
MFRFFGDYKENENRIVLITRPLLIPKMTCTGLIIQKNPGSVLNFKKK